MNLSPKNTQTKQTFLDANILLEIILGRPQEATARQILANHADSLCISALTAHLLVHFGVARTNLSVIRDFLDDYTILPLNDFDFDWAFTNIRNDDFEDALQLAVAVRGHCDQFITFDKRLAKAYENLPGIKVLLA